MQRLTFSVTAVTALCVCTVLGCATSAWANRGNPYGAGRVLQKGELDENSAGAAAGGSRRITYSGSGSGDGSGGGGNLSVPAGSNWSPPPCWYAPTYSPKELKAKLEDSPFSVTGRSPNNGGNKQETDSAIWERYTEGKYEDFNLDKQGEGSFWAAVPNPNEPDAAKAQSCTELPFWVKNGEQPEVENAISPKILSALAYERIQVPDTEVELNPKDRQTVNLPTWVWLDKGTYRPLSVTASVDLGGGAKISATTTVKPESLALSAGTEDARLHPGSGECPVGEDGGIGSPYEKGSGKKTPPCGVTYLRATQDGGGYPLKATLTWDASWEGTGGAGDDELPDGRFGDTRNVTVQEIQSIN
ncbi:hypothetical protein ABZ820_06940 [Streptomyces diacarni]|uniref:hypothetical protein n=1 Tax=Streptomyces diacarni TaxID=2800381 RepID=UPI00340E67DA